VGDDPVVAGDSTVYCTSIAQLHAIDRTGEVRWSTQFEDSVLSPTLLGDGTIVVGGLNGKFYAVDHAGKIRWEFATECYGWTSPVIADDETIYVGSDDYRLYALRPCQ
jgi:hypothetical protein